MAEIIDNRSVANAENGGAANKENEWDALVNMPEFTNNLTSSLSNESKKQVDDKLLEINEDEKKDYQNHAISHKHTKEEYEKMRQGVIRQALDQDLSKLDEHSLSELNYGLRQIREDEEKDYSNESAIDHRHTKEEYDHLRQNLIKVAIEDAERKANLTEGADGADQDGEKDTTEEDDETKDKDEDEEKAKQEAEQNSKEEAEAKAKQEAEQNPKEEAEAIQKDIDEKNNEIEQIKKELGPLVGINADRTQDKKELAHDFAERELNAENAKSNFIKRIWKGNLFKKYYEKKYEREIMEGERHIDVNGEQMTLDQYIKDHSESSIHRFLLSVDEEYGESLVHRKAGETRTEASKETTAAVSNVIKKFATEWAKNNANTKSLRDNKDIRREFENSIREELAKLHDSINPSNQIEVDNYYDVALEAKDRAEIVLNAGNAAAHEVAMNRVMEGFKIYNAEVRDNVRTEAHRDNLDKIVNKLESSAIGQFIPPEILAGAVSTAFAITQSGTRAIAGVAGGIGVSGLFAGLRERNRVTEDRARMMRDIAVGLEYGSDNKGDSEKKQSRYEASIGGTEYNILSATQLTNNLEWALKTKNNNVILRAIAEARVRIDYSDSEQKDLISFSSADKIGDERTRLDIAVIKAEHALSDQEKRKLETLKDVVEKRIEKDVDEKDKDFRKIRTAQAIKQAGKTVLFGTAFFLGSQEVMAAIDPNKIGYLEKTGALEKLGIKVNNNENASETILAGLAGSRVQTETSTSVIEGVSGNRQVEMERYEQMGYKRIQKSPAYTETKTDIVDVPPAQSSHALKVETSFADNGTSMADGNELGLHLENGRYIAKLSGSSTMNNEVFNYEELANAGRIKGHINIGGGTFEMASKVDASGQITWPIDANGNITTTTGETIKAFGDNGEKLFKAVRVVVDNGPDADGVKHVVSLAADAGTDSFTGTIQQVAETTIEHPAIYDFTKTTISQIPRSVTTTTAGIVAPFVSRAGLGETSQRIESTPTPTVARPVPAEAPAPTPGTTSAPTPSAPEGNPPAADVPASPAAEAAGAPTPPPQTPPEPTTAPTNTAPSGADTATGDSGDGAPTATNNEASTGDTNKAPNAELLNDIRERFKDAGEEWINLIADERTYGNFTESQTRHFSEMWQQLDQDTRNKIIEYEAAKDQNAKDGRALRHWLATNGYM